MTGSIERAERTRTRVPANGPEGGARSSIVRAGVAASLMGLGAVVGGATAYCDGIGGAMLGMLFFALGIPIEALMRSPGEFVLGLLGYIAVVLIVAKLSPLKLGARIVVPAILFSAALSWLATSVVNHFGHTNSAFMESQTGE